ncbi:MAG: exosortase W [Nitrospirota bacterium]
MKFPDNAQKVIDNSKLISFTMTNRLTAIKIFLVIGIFLFAIGSIIPLMSKIWSRYDYSHGFLIPFISLYLIWLKRNNLKPIAIKPHYAGGLIVLISGCLMLILSKIGSVAMIQLLSVIVMIAGTILLLLGVKYSKALAIPVAYLVLTVPLLDLIHDKISFPLQLFSATIVSTVLSFLNIPVFQNAQYLEFPSITLEVAPECSGISFLISFIAIGIPLAYFTQKSIFRRIMLVAYAIFCCIFANLLRIMLMGFWTYHGGEYVHGPFHIFIGAFISVVGFIFLFLGAFIFAETTPRQLQRYQPEKEKTSGLMFDSKRFNRALFMLFVVLFLTGGYLYLYNPQPVALKNSLNDLDFKIGKWTGSKTSLNLEDLKIGGADSEITRIYRDQYGREVKLHVAYFASQRQGKEIVFYTLQRLYTATREIAIDIDLQKGVRINKAMMANGPEQAFPVLYWYDVQGNIITNRYAAKLLIALNGLIRGRTNGALIIVYSDEKRLDNIEQALNVETDFVKELMPVLDRYLPGH